MLVTALLSLLCCPPQEPETMPVGGGFQRLDNGLRVRVETVPGGEHQALVLIWPTGSNCDPQGQAGLAQTMARWIALAQPDPAIEAENWHTVVRGPFTMLHCSVPFQRAGERVAYLARILGGELEPGPDVVALARARAALQADDMAEQFPGDVLRTRAQQALLAGTAAARAVGGTAGEIEKLDVGILRGRLRSAYGPSHAIFASMGGLDGEAADALIIALGGASPELPPPAPVVPAPVPPGEPFTEHSLVDAPFVTAAIVAPAPDSGELLPFAIAMEVLRARALYAFRSYRGGEARARFPFLDFSFAYGDRVALINRRGANDEAREPVEGEIRSLLRSITERGITGVEAANGSRVLAANLALPPYDDRVRRAMTQEPSALLSRTLVLALYALWQWPDELCRHLGQVRIADVQRVLHQNLADERVHWFGLLPRPVRDGRKD